MSQSNNTLAIALGAIALLAVGGGAGFFFASNMSKEAVVANTAGPASGETAVAAAAGKPQATEEEKQEADAAVTTFQGVEVKKGNPVVARVNGEDITRVDVFRYIKMMPANIQQLPAQAIYPMALEQVINTALVETKAEEAGLESDAEVQKQLELAKLQIIRSVYVQRELDKQISDADLKKKYDELIAKTPDVEQAKASHILVDSEAKAQDIIAKLKGGADFAKLAAENSGDPSNKDKGGDLGWFTQQEMVKEFADAAFKLEKGKISETPVKTQFGYHVVKLEDKRNRPKPPFDEVKPMLKVEVQREKLESLMESWKSAAKIEKFDINGDPIKEQTEVAPAAGEAVVPDAQAPATGTAQ